MSRKPRVNNRYLQRRRRTWYVRVAVPPRLVPVIGKRDIVRSLQTRDASVARERRWQAVAEIQRWLRSQAVDPVTEGLEDREWRLDQDNTVRDPDTRHTQRDAAKLIIAEIAEALEARQGRAAASTYHRVATSEDQVLRDVEQRWLAEVRGEVTGQTMAHYEHGLKLLHRYGGDALLFVSQVDRRFAGRFISEVVRPGRAPRTVDTIIAALSAFWTWMVRKGLAEANPFTNQTGRQDRRGGPKPKRSYTASELLRLLRADPEAILGERYGPAIRDLLRLALMTGARLDELCALKVQDVDQRQHAIWVQRGKTKAARRIIPVHPVVWPIVLRRIESAQSGELFPELPAQGRDHKKSIYASQRFTAYRRHVLGEDETLDFHSLRRTFATYMEHAQGRSVAVHPGLIAEIMGHAKGTLALSVYSGGHRIEHLRKAIDALKLVIEPEVLKAVSRGDAQATSTSQNGAAALSGRFSEGRS
jgi:integrase